MPRRSRQKSWFDHVLDRLVMVSAIILGVVVAISILVAEQPMFAAAIGILFVILLAAILYLRWRSRRETARRHVAQAKHLGQLLTMSGEEFEATTADLFRSLGFREVVRTGGSGDLGVDLQATSPDGLRVVIQCKRYGRGQKVGSPAVQSLMGAVVNSGAEMGIFVTTSTFTGPAFETAKTGRVSIKLIDGDELTKLAEHAAGGATKKPRWSTSSTN